jgi:hypothetical protein
MIAHAEARERDVRDARTMMAQRAQLVVRKQHTVMSHRVDVSRRFTTADRILVARKAARAPRRDEHNVVGIVIVREIFGRPFLSQVVYENFCGRPFHKKTVRCWTVN